MNDFLYIATTTGIAVCDWIDGEWRQVRRALENLHVTSLALFNHTILAGTRDGIFCSNDSGEHWEERSHGLSVRHVRSVHWHSFRPVKMLVGTEPAAIFYSSDCSDHWQESPEVVELRDQFGWYLPYSPEAGCVRDFAFSRAYAYAAVEQGGVLISEDGGVLWEMAGGSTGKTDAPDPESGFIHPDVHSIYTHPLKAEWVYAPTGGGLYLSKNHGKSWQRLYGCYCRGMWVNPKDARHIIFGPADGVDRLGRIEESKDGGKTWLPASTGLDVPWERHMVEQFVQVQDHLVGVLSNGELIAAPLQSFEWRAILPDIRNARAAATGSGS
jgi:hypothetical protein